MAKLYVGNLPWETEEQELRGLFASCGNVLSLEIPKGRQERSRGYALVEYSSPMEAAAAVQRLNGHSVGGREISVREDKPVPPKSERAPKSERPAKASGNAPAVADGLRVYVGNLAWETTDEELIGHFGNSGTITRAEVARQGPAGRSKGWALVDFTSAADAAQAIASLNNSDLGGRSIIARLERSGPAPAKAERERAPRAERAERPERVRDTRPENSSGRQIVVRNLPWTTTSEDLREVFQQVGTVLTAISVCHEDTGRSKGWGTVLFETAEQANAAIAGFNGVELEGRAMTIKIDRFE